MKRNSKKKTKTTFWLNPVIFSRFSEEAKELGLRRDAYLNSVLPGEVQLLRRLAANSAKVERFLKMDRKVRQSSLVRVGITLDADVVEAINGVCSSKGIPRDLFIERCLEYLIRGPIPGEGDGPAPLPGAAELIVDPRSQWSAFKGDRAYGSLHLTEEGVRHLLTQASGEKRS